VDLALLFYISFLLLGQRRSFFSVERKEVKGVLTLLIVVPLRGSHKDEEDFNPEPSYIDLD